MKGLNRLERAVLAKLLDGDHHALFTLREQAETVHLLSRDFTRTGFFCKLQLPAGASILATEIDFHLGDVDATMDGLEFGAGFVLFIRNGSLDTLEGYSYEEPWPEVIRQFELTYQNEPRELRFPEPLPETTRA